MTIPAISTDRPQGEFFRPKGTEETQIPNKARGGQNENSSDSAKLSGSGEDRVDTVKRYLDTRGLEVTFRIEPTTGSAQMVIVEPSTGREVVEVPPGSSLENAVLQAVSR